MLEKLKPKSKRRIYLKDGNNYKFLVGLVFIILVGALLGTSKQWLADDRDNMTKNVQTSMYFAMSTLDIDSYSVDTKNQIGEIRLHEEIKNTKEKYVLTYKVYDENGKELPLKVIESKIDEKGETQQTKQIILQFAVYEDFYFIRVTAKQEKQKIEEITIDYRDFKHQKVIEKGQDFLVELNQQKNELSDIQEEIEPITTRIDTLQKELDEINALDKEEKKKKEARITEIEKLLKAEDEKLKPLQKDYDDLDTKIKKLEK